MQENEIKQIMDFIVTFKPLVQQLLKVDVKSDGLNNKNFKDTLNLLAEQMLKDLEWVDKPKKQEQKQEKVKVRKFLDVLGAEIGTEIRLEDLQSWEVELIEEKAIILVGIEDDIFYVGETINDLMDKVFVNGVKLFLYNTQTQEIKKIRLTYEYCE